MTISERLFDIIDSKKGKSAAGLCKYLSLNTSVTTNWKQRNTDPPAKYIIPICEYLDVSVIYLLTGVEQSTDLYSNTSQDEDRILQKYRTLDEDGKDAVRGVLLAEQRRVESEKGEAKTVG